MKSILLFANDDPGLGGRIAAALDLAAANGAHLTCLQSVPFDSFVMSDPFGGVYAMPTLMDEIERKKKATRERVEECLRRAQASWSWLDYTGEPASLLIERSRLADIVVVSLVASHERQPERSLFLAGDVALHARALTLAVPESCAGFQASGRALVAWNGSAESSHALRLATPLLKSARIVDVLTVVEDEPSDFPATQACEYLGYHGVRPELHEWPRHGRTVAECISDAAASLDASYIVMGAYGHSRLREAVLGGVTRTMLMECERPLLLGH